MPFYFYNNGKTYNFRVLKFPGFTVYDNIEETPSFSRGLPESDDIDNEDVAYMREDCEGYMLKKTS